MKKLGVVLLFIIGLLVGTASAQYTAVTGTITEPSGQVWAGASVTVAFKGAPGFGGKYTWNGHQYQTLPSVLATANNSGVFTANIPDVNTIVPAGTTWTVSMCPLASVVCSNTGGLVITGTTQNITSLITPYVQNISINPTPLQTAYNSGQVNAAPGVGQIFYNTLNSITYQWNGSSWNPLVGSGSVVSVGVGTWPSWLTPSVASPTTSPVISVTSSAIPNNALATPYVIINGVTANLGSSVNTPITCGGNTANCPLQQLNPTSSATTVTTASVTTSQTTIPIASGTGFTFAPGVYVAIANNSNIEWVACTAYTSPNLTGCTRGGQGSTPEAWASGSVVIQATSWNAASSSTFPSSYTLANQAYGQGVVNNVTANTFESSLPYTLLGGLIAGGAHPIEFEANGGNTIYSQQAVVQNAGISAGTCGTSSLAITLPSTSYSWVVGGTTLACSIGSENLPPNTLFFTPGATNGVAPVVGNPPAMSLSVAGVVNVPAGGNFEINGVPVGGGGISDLTPGIYSIATAATAIGNGHLDEITNAGDITATLPMYMPLNSKVNGQYICTVDGTNCPDAADITLTTIGSSGPATKIGNTLNIPVYTPSTGAFAALNPSNAQTITSVPSVIGLTLQQDNEVSYQSPTGFYQYQKCGAQGYNLGSPWTSCVMENDVLLDTMRGIKHLRSETFNDYAIGDDSVRYASSLHFGGCVAPSDECGHDSTIQNHQTPWPSGPVANPTAGNIGVSVYGGLVAGNAFFNPAAVFETTGNAQTLSVNFYSAPSAQTGYFFAGTLNTATTQITITNVWSVSVAASSGVQTFTAGTDFTTSSVNAGEVLGFYLASTNTVGGTSTNPYCLPSSGTPTSGAYTYSTGNAACNVGGYYGGIVIQATQAAPTQAPTSLVASPITPHGYFDYNIGPVQFNDGGMLLDSSQVITTATLGTKSVVLGAISYALTSGTVPVSTAFGTVTSCSASGNGESQTPSSGNTTCVVTLSTSPSSGSFIAPITFTGSTTSGSTTVNVSSTTGLVAGQMFISPGVPPYDAIVSVGSGTVVLTTAATATESSVAMSINTNIYLGGAGTWQEESPVISVTAASGGTQTLTFTSRYTSPLGETVMQGGIGGTAIVPTANLSTWPVAWQVLGATSPTQTVISNCIIGNCHAGNLPGSVAVTFLPMAFETGTNGGISGSVQLGPNQLAPQIGDTIFGAPTSEYSNSSLFIVQGQNTPVDFSIPSTTITIIHDGSQGPGSDFEIQDENGTTATNTLFNLKAQYNTLISMTTRPNTCIICLQNNSGGNYTIFDDYYLGEITADVTNGTFDFNIPITTTSVTATGAVSQFASGTTFGGVLPCLQNNTNCSLPSPTFTGTTTLNAGTATSPAPLLIEGNGSQNVQFNILNSSNTSEWQFFVPGSGGYGTGLSPFCYYTYGSNEVVVCNSSTGIQIGSGESYQFGSTALAGNTAVSSDTNLSRASAGVLAAGTGSAGSTAGQFKAAGYIHSGTKFTASGCSITSLIGGATAGSFTSGTAGTCTVVVTTGITAPNGYACFSNDLTTITDAIRQTATTATTFTLSGTTVSGDSINFGCDPY
jgi:hypothetical protein